MSKTYKDTQKYKREIADKLNIDEVCIGGISPTFKKIRKKKRRAMEKLALRNGQEPPQFKRSDEYDWW